MNVIDDDYLIEKLSATASDPAFRYSILPRACRAYAHGFHGVRCQHITHLLAELGITIQDRVSVRTRFGTQHIHSLRRILEHDNPLPEPPPVTPLSESARTLALLAEIEPCSLESYAHLDAAGPLAGHDLSRRYVLGISARDPGVVPTLLLRHRSFHSSAPESSAEPVTMRLRDAYLRQ